MRGDLRVVVDNRIREVHQDSPFFVVPSYFVVVVEYIGRPVDPDTLRRAYN